MTLDTVSIPPTPPKKPKYSRRNKTLLSVAVIFLAVALLAKIPFLSHVTRHLSLVRPVVPVATKALPSKMVYSTKPASNGEAVLSAKEEREWNHMAEGMSYYHNHFRHSFDSIYEVSRRT